MQLFCLQKFYSRSVDVPTDLICFGSETKSAGCLVKDFGTDSCKVSQQESKVSVDYF